MEHAPVVDNEEITWRKAETYLKALIALEHPPEPAVGAVVILDHGVRQIERCDGAIVIAQTMDLSLIIQLDDAASRRQIDASRPVAEGNGVTCQEREVHRRLVPQRLGGSPAINDDGLATIRARL